MVYKWRTFDYPVSAQAAGEHIEELDREHGHVTPEILLEDSRPEDALLHPLYEWRDDVAAEKYRLRQAGKILRELVVVHVNAPNFTPKEPVRAFTSVAAQNETGVFRPIVVAMSDEVTREQVLANARAELDRMKSKYKGLLDFAALLADYLNDMKGEQS